ncbi:MAG: VWA domain-containing protein [Acidobacteriia bacterium]|nr:VWA domain-containing protein [Terriglobia bacterium]
MTNRVFAQAPAGPLPPRPGVAIQEPPKESGAAIKKEVRLVTTPVTVRDASGQMLHNVAQEEFRIFDNGTEQRITHFDLGGDPLSVVILLETSSRIEPMIPELRKTGILFTQQVMGPSGEAAVVTFNDTIEKRLEFSSDAAAIEKTIAEIKQGTSGTKLYDAMAAGVEMLTSRPEAPSGAGTRRRVLIVVSEAADKGSAAALGEVLRQAQLANVTIYSVGLSTTRAELQAEPRTTAPTIAPPGTYPLPPRPGTVPTPTSDPQYNGGNIDLLALAAWIVQHIQHEVKDHALEVAAAGTGGMHVRTFRDASIEKAIDEIGGELHAQYALSYTPTGSGEFGYHEIEVRVRRPNLSVRSRPGYYLASPE